MATPDGVDEAAAADATVGEVTSAGDDEVATASVAAEVEEAGGGVESGARDKDDWSAEDRARDESSSSSSDVDSTLTGDSATAKDKENSKKLKHKIKNKISRSN